MEKRRLGRGLDDLLGLTQKTVEAGNLAVKAEVPLSQIELNPFQPRKAFDQDELAAMSATVKSHGILQPLVVRQVGDHYQIVAGERRLRAAREAGLVSVPVRIVDFNDQEVLEAALIENIHRTDLNPIEKAQGFKDYLDRFALNHEQLAQKLGLARSTITNLVNLLELPPDIQEGLRVNQISEAHAKILKGIKDPDRQMSLYKQIVAMGLSVKATEAMLRDQKNEEPAGTPNGELEDPAVPQEKTAHVRGLEDELRQKLATPVEIRLRGKEKGQIIIRFDNNDDFMRVLEALRR